MKTSNRALRKVQGFLLVIVLIVGFAIFALPAQASTHKSLNLFNCPTLYQGMSSDCVTELQNDLNANGADPQLTPDGIFGPLAYKAVEAFQSVHKLKLVDGIVGAETKSAIENPTCYKPVIKVYPGSTSMHDRWAEVDYLVSGCGTNMNTYSVTTNSHNNNNGNLAQLTITTAAYHTATSVGMAVFHITVDETQCIGVKGFCGGASNHAEFDIHAYDNGDANHTPVVYSGKKGMTIYDTP